MLQKPELSSDLMGHHRTRLYLPLPAYCFAESVRCWSRWSLAQLTKNDRALAEVGISVPHLLCSFIYNQRNTPKLYLFDSSERTPNAGGDQNGTNSGMLKSACDINHSWLLFLNYSWSEKQLILCQITPDVNEKNKNKALTTSDLLWKLNKVKQWWRPCHFIECYVKDYLFFSQLHLWHDTLGNNLVIRVLSARGLSLQHMPSQQLPNLYVLLYLLPNRE